MRRLGQLGQLFLWQFMKGRVSIERWWRDGDREPIELIENLSCPRLGASNHEEAMKEALRELLNNKVRARETCHQPEEPMGGLHERARIRL